MDYSGTQGLPERTPGHQNEPACLNDGASSSKQHNTEKNGGKWPRKSYKTKAAKTGGACHEAG